MPRPSIPARRLLAGALLFLCSPISSVAGPEPTAASVLRPAPLEAQSRRTTRRTTRRRAPAKPAAPRAPRWAATTSAAGLEAALGNILANSVKSGTWGVFVVSLSRGDTLFTRNGGSMLQPASTMKMFTASVAFDRLGADHSFITAVTHDGTIEGGALRGNLYLRGTGDPSLSTRYHRDVAPMDQLAQQVAARGIQRVTGAVVADGSAFEDRLVPEGWQSRYLGAAYAARVSALTLDENLVWVVVQPSGGQAAVTLEPASTAAPVINNVRLVAGSGGRISAIRRSDGAIQVRGTIGRNSAPRKYSLVVDNPPQFMAGALAAALAKAGVAVDGGVRVGPSTGADAVLATVKSPPLWQIVSAMNRESINIFAELLFRNAGRHAEADSTRQGTAATGLAALRDFLSERAGVAPQEVEAADGSGLSVLDRVTPRAMVHLLGYAHHAPWGPSFHASLPVAGVSETLRTRMRNAPAQGNLHAKTGTTNTVASLGGYVTAKNGEVLAFSFLYNGTDRWNARSTMDAMGSTLAEFAR